MRKLKKGDIVTRNSYGNDIMFYIENIITNDEGIQIATLKGVILRIEADAYLDDLKIEDKRNINNNIKNFENELKNVTTNILQKYKDKNVLKRIEKNTGIILHLDGDKKYAEKSSSVYSKFNLCAIVKNIKETKQPFEIENLLNKYNPDIVVITGHDGMLKKGYKYNDINNYKNSKYFVETVKRIREWEQGSNSITIFAGACQSYYEAIMDAGANFASSPARILIDFMDPLIVAETVATTNESKYITMQDIRDKLRDGERGISGIGSYGKESYFI